MCGITGIVSTSKVDKLEKRIKKMVLSIKHRGPDNQSYKILNEKIALGHARLSIIDLNDSSNQPMISDDKRWTIVFNGEIFNYLDIKSQLDYPFKTNGDTEVILAAVQLKGLDWFLKKANGMYAFALYDSLCNQTYLVRDRFSIKPLYYTIDNGTLIFGSEIKAILNSGLIEAKFFSPAIDEYLGNRSVREPYTFFTDIFQVCGGQYIVFDDKLNKKVKGYYKLPKQNFDQNYNEQQLIDDTTKQVENAIKRWLVSDVKVGSYLSGGVDSSLTTAIMATSMKNSSNLCTYTIGFKSNNEFEYSKIVADKYKVKHKNILIDYSTYVDEWKRLIYYNDAPLGVPNEVPLSIMSTELSKDITVVISGEGADELFGGYGRIYRLPNDYNNHPSNLEFYDEFINQYEYVPRNIRNKFLKTDMCLREYFDNKIKKDFSKHCNEENVFRFFQQYHIKGLLRRVDMTTMQTSVEARPPFLDHKLIEFVSTKIPYDLKLKWISQEDKIKSHEETAKQYSEVRDIPKYILKKVAEKYLPNEIIYRKKVGFPVPLSEWLNELDCLVDLYLKDAYWLDNSKLNELISDAKKNDRSGQILWMFINIEMFRQQYFNKEWRY